MRVEIITKAGPSLASFRLRLMPILEAARELGWDVSVSDRPTKTADIVVYSKHFGADEVCSAQREQARGAFVLYDVCNFHPPDGVHGPHYRDMIRIADRVTTHGAYLRKLILAKYGVDACVVPDRIDSGAKYPPTVAHRARPQDLRILWFGHPCNLAPLVKCMDRLSFKIGDGLNLTILTAVTPQVVKMLGKWADGLKRWSMDAQDREIRDSDVIIIPCDTSEIWRAKSPNRFVSVLNAGRFCVASDIEPYRGLREYGFVGDIADGVQFAFSFPGRSKERIRAGQEYIEKHFSPGLVREKWKQLLKESRDEGKTL